MSSDYWVKRLDELWQNQDRDIANTTKNLERYYRTISQEINQEIAAFYGRYGDDIKEFRHLQLALPIDIKSQLFADWDAFAKKYPQYAHLQPVRDQISRLNRIEGLQYSITQKTLELGAIENQQLETLLEESYKNGYLGILNSVENYRGFVGVNQEALEKILTEGWVESKNFSDRIWRNKAILAEELKKGLADSLLRGDAYAKTSRQIKETTGAALYNAKRLVHTEAAFALNQANKDAFVQAGYKKYRYVIVFDYRTSDICISLSDKVFAFAAARAGVNYPPLHPWCRSSVVPVGQPDRYHTIVNTTTSGGIKIKNISGHATTQAKARGVSPDSVFQAISKPLEITPPKIDNRGRASQKYIGRDATVAINPDTGVVTTVYPTSTQRKRRF